MNIRIFLMILLSASLFAGTVFRQVSLNDIADEHSSARLIEALFDEEIDASLACAVTRAVDIVFCIDSTGSMGGHIAGVRAAIRGFCEAMDSAGYNYALGAVTYGDGQNHWDFDLSTPEIELTTDIDEFMVLLNACGAAGGADAPETTLDAIYEAISLYNWRPFAVPIVIMFTDIHTCALDHPSYPGTGCCCYHETNVTSTQVLDAVLTSGTYVYNIFPHSLVRSRCPWSYDRYVGISSASGARTYELGISFETIFADIVSDLYETINIRLSIENRSGESIDSLTATFIPTNPSCMTILSSNPLVLSDIPDDGEASLAWRVAIDSLCPLSAKCFEIAVSTDAGHIDTLSGCAINEICGCPEHEAFILMPRTDGIITACAEQEITAVFRASDFEHFPDEASIEVSVNDVLYTTADPELTLDSSYISFAPSVPWEHGDTISFCVLSAFVMSDCPLEEPICGNFIVDFNPPRVFEPVPPPGTAFFTEEIEIEFSISDDLAGIDLGASFIEINGVRYDPDSEFISYLGDSLAGTVHIAANAIDDFGLDAFDTIHICFFGVDLTDEEYCGPNVTEECFIWEIMLYSREIWFEEHYASPCDTVLIPLWMDTTEASYIGSADFQISFDPDILVPIAIEHEGSLTEGWSGLYDVDFERATLSANIGGDVIEAGAGGVLFWVKAFVQCDARVGDYCHLRIDSFAFPGISGDVDLRNGIFICQWRIAPWLLDLDIDGAERAGTHRLTIGGSAHTTDLFDPGSDIVYRAPSPDFVNAWLSLNDPAYPHVNALKRDMRGIEPPVRWVIKSMGVTESAQIRWNPDRLPEGIFMIDNVIDMKIDTIAFFTVGDSVVIEWTLPDIGRGMLEISAGWNLISLQFHPPSLHPTEIFPFSHTGAIGYNTRLRRYEEASRFRNGAGYWLFSMNDTTTILAGIPTESYTINIYRGWNLIGSLIEPLNIDDFCTSIPDIVIGDIYGYQDTAYIAVDTLMPGKGYWLFSIDDAVLSVPTGSSMYCRPFLGLGTPLWDFKVNIDNEIFLLGHSPEADVSLDGMDIVMPPLAPNESLYEKAYISRDGFMLRRDISPIASWTIQVPNNADITFDIPAGLDNLKIELSGGDIALNNGTRLCSLEGGLYRIYIDQAPTHFELVGAYPNPFNSTVAVSWLMPERGDITVEIFDVLGNKVATILDDNVAGGKNTAVWDADGHISGVYFFSIKTRDGIKSGSVTFLK